MENINTEIYWDKRFSNDWQQRGGESQSEFFARIALSQLPVWLTTYIKKDNPSFCDWGCAMGNGTFEIKNQLQCSKVTGVDFSAVAIEKASAAYPGIKFVAANYLEKLPREKFDILFTSNTLEHFPDPWSVAEQLAQITNEHLVILVPYQETGNMEQEHYYSFDKNNIPAAIGKHLFLTYSAVVDASTMEPSYWNGAQVLLVYSSIDFIKKQKLTAEQVKLELTVEHTSIAEEDVFAPLHDSVKQLSNIIEVQRSQAIEKEVEIERFISLLRGKDRIITENAAQVIALQQEIVNQQKQVAAVMNEKSMVEQARNELKVKYKEDLEKERELAHELQEQLTLLQQENKLLQKDSEALKVLQSEIQQLHLELGKAGTAYEEAQALNQKLESDFAALQKTNNETASEKIAADDLKKATYRIKLLEAQLEKQKYINTTQKQSFDLVVNEHIQRKQNELNKLYEDYGQLSSKYYDLLNSRSWRYTQYLRLPFYHARKLLYNKKGEPEFRPAVIELKHEQGGGLSMLTVTENVAKENNGYGLVYSSNGNGLVLGDDIDFLPHQHEAKLKVAILVQDFVEGGVERVSLDLALRLKEKGFATSILVATSGGKIMHEGIAAGIDVHVFGNSTSKFEKHIHDNRPDVVFTNHSYFGLEALKQNNIPTVEIIHNAYFWQKGIELYNKIRRKHISRFVAVSRSVNDYSIKHLGIHQDKIQIINNGLNIDEFIRPPLQLRELIRERSKPGKFVFIMLAGIRPSKCHHTAISAFSILHKEYPDAELWFAGNIDNKELFDSIMNRVKSNGIANHVQYLGCLNRRQLSKVLLDSDCALLPSSYEGFSIASLEYMFFGLPSILTDVGSARDVNENEDTGIIVDAPFEVSMLDNERIHQNSLDQRASNVDSLAHAMKRMIAEKDVWALKRQSIAEKADKYSIDMTVDKYVKLIEEVTTEKQVK